MQDAAAAKRDCVGAPEDPEFKSPQPGSARTGLRQDSGFEPSVLTLFSVFPIAVRVMTLAHYFSVAVAVSVSVFCADHQSLHVAYARQMVQLVFASDCRAGHMMACASAPLRSPHCRAPPTDFRPSVPHGRHWPMTF